MRLKLSWELMSGLEATYGDSFYLLHPDAFEANYTRFLAAFRKYYPNTSLAYSYKTNYTPLLCRLVSDWGGYAEVVSRMEYDLASRLGVSPSKIIYNGPGKPAPDIETALLAGSMVNIDASREMSIVEAVAHRHSDRQMTVGVRCNFDIGTGQTSRFGLDAEGGDVEAAIRRLGDLANCSVAGLHCHFATPDKRVEMYALVATRMLELAARAFPDQPPKFIDLGGGFFGPMLPELERQFDRPAPTYDDYARAIAPAFAQAFGDGSGPELLLEPGMALTADVMQFVARVTDVKTIRARTVALVSASMYDVKPTLHTKNLPLSVIPAADQGDPPSAVTDVDIVGSTCMEHDVLFRSYSGPLAVGDYVVFSNVGAYTTVLRPPFINPSPPMVAYDSATGGFEVVKRTQTADDLFSTYKL